RRRHTRFSRDWSSDVCSSDLQQLRLAAGEHQFLTFDSHEDGISWHEFPGEDLLSQRVLNLLLNGTFQRARTVYRIEACFCQLIHRLFIPIQAEVPFSQTSAEQIQLNIGYATDLFATQWMEYHHFVNTVDELGPEVSTYNLHYSLFHRIVTVLVVDGVIGIITHNIVKTYRIK